MRFLEEEQRRASAAESRVQAAEAELAKAKRALARAEQDIQRVREESAQALSAAREAAEKDVSAAREEAHQVRFRFGLPHACRSSRAVLAKSQDMHGTLFTLPGAGCACDQGERGGAREDQGPRGAAAVRSQALGGGPPNPHP